MDDTAPGAGSDGPGDAGGPAGVPGLAPAAAGGPVAERMQTLLSRAVEAQVGQQREASAALDELRRQIADLAERLSGSGTADRAEQLDARVEGLAGTLSTQTAALERVGAAVRALASLPDALRALQREVAGMHDRLAALAVERRQAEERLVEALAPRVADLVLRLVDESRDGQRQDAPVSASASALAPESAPAAAPEPAAAPTAGPTATPTAALVAAPAAAAPAAADVPQEGEATSTRPGPPVQPRPEVSARFASASNVFGPPSDGTDGGPRRRAWWRPGS